MPAAATATRPSTRIVPADWGKVRILQASICLNLASIVTAAHSYPESNKGGRNRGWFLPVPRWNDALEGRRPPSPTAFRVYLALRIKCPHLGRAGKIRRGRIDDAISEGGGVDGDGSSDGGSSGDGGHNGEQGRLRQTARRQGRRGLYVEGRGPVRANHHLRGAHRLDRCKGQERQDGRCGPGV